jgi:predicted phosphodiesterase
MRNLIILKGPSESGKTGLARDLNLLPWHLDQEAISRVHASPSLNEDGDLNSWSQARRRSDDFLLATLRSKMDKSEFIVLELGHVPAERERIAEQLLADILLTAERHRYGTTIVDFGATPVEGRTLSALGQQGRKPFVRVLTPRDFASRIDKFKNPVTDISHADAIVAIGDIHANADALETCLNQIQGRDRVAFIFTGDYLNKGPAPARTLRLLSQFKQSNSDCFLVSGNHEIMLENWAWRRGPNRDVFSRDTLHDLQAQQYSRKEARKFLSKVRDHARLSWRGYDILATHGGISAPVDAPGLLSGHQKRFGVGQSSLDIDRVWERNCTDPKKIQIHGHRNIHQVDVSQSSRSFNLEGIDAFGQMRGMVLRPDGSGIKAQGFSVPIPGLRRRKKQSTS